MIERRDTGNCLASLEVPLVRPVEGPLFIPPSTWLPVFTEVVLVRLRGSWAQSWQWKFVFSPTDTVTAKDGLSPGVG